MSKTRHKFPRTRAAPRAGGTAQEPPAGEKTGGDESLTVFSRVGRAGRGFGYGTRLRDAVFFICLFVYLWLVVDSRLIAHCAGPLSGDLPVFYRGWTFLREVAGHPGGPAEYVGAFLFQLFTPAWLGAVVVTGLAWLLFLCVGGCFAAPGCSRFGCLRHVPALLVLAIYSQYAHCITGIVALLAVLCLIPPYLRISVQGTRQAMICFIVVSPLLYYLAGAGYLVFAATCMLHEAIIKRRWALAGCYPLVAAAVPYALGVRFFGTPLASAFIPYAFAWNVTVPGQPLWAVWLLYLLVPAGLVLTGLARWISKRREPAPVAGAGETPPPEKPRKRSKSGVPPGANRPAAASGPWAAGVPGLFQCAGLLLPLVLAAGIARFTYTAKEKCQREVDFCAYHEMWEQVLAASRGDPANPAIVQTVARALCHTGRLPGEMFSHPQSVPALLMGTDEPMSWQWAGIWLDAGFVNAAEHQLAQAQETLGEQPAILQQLALIHMVKGNTGTARIYLNALARTVSLNDWATKYLNDLEHDPELSKDERIQWLRSAMPKDSGQINDRTLDDWFLVLLKRNPKNRAAFEYLMALCLVAGRPDKVVENIHRLNDFDYPRPYLPEHYAEAVAAYAADGKGRMPDLRGWQIREETRQRFRTCMEIARRYKGDPTAMKNELRKRFPGSYFRYLLTGESGNP